MSPFAGQTPLPTLSLCMIVKNEESNLERCLNSVRGVVDEIVLVDTGSTDRTVGIAQAFGAKILHHPWHNDFAQARNVGLDQATGEWILVMDADEELEADSRQRIKPTLAQTEAQGLRVIVRSASPPGGLIAYSDSVQERLFLNCPNYRYEQPIHESILNSIARPGGRLAATDLVLWHYGYVQGQVQGEDDRARRNLQLLEQAAAESPLDPSICVRLGFSYYGLGNYSLAYTYLRRALVDLESRQLTPELMETSLWVLWNSAFILKDHNAVASCAKAMQKLYANGALSAQALYALGRTRLLDGEEGLQLAASEAPEAPGTLEHFQAAGQLLKQAYDYLAQLRGSYPLTASAAERVETDLQVCRSRLAAAGQGVAAAHRRIAAREALRQLLAAPDIVLAFDQVAATLRPEVAVVARLEVAKARAEANPILAEGLETLAEWIEQALGAGAPAE